MLLQASDQLLNLDAFSSYLEFRISHGKRTARIIGPELSDVPSVNIAIEAPISEDRWQTRLEGSHTYYNTF